MNPFTDSLEKLNESILILQNYNFSTHRRIPHVPGNIPYCGPLITLNEIGSSCGSYLLHTIPYDIGDKALRYYIEFHKSTHLVYSQCNIRHNRTGGPKTMESSLCLKVLNSFIMLAFGLKLVVLCTGSNWLFKFIFH